MKILFVCLGNICRSSSAEEVMRTFIKREGLENVIEVDSAGILSIHQGELSDSRMRMHASRRGYTLTHRSRPVCTEDFFDFDMIVYTILQCNISVYSLHFNYLFSYYQRWEKLS